MANPLQNAAGTLGQAVGLSTVGTPTQWSTTTNYPWSGIYVPAPTPLPKCECGEPSVSYCLICGMTKCFSCFILHFSDGHARITGTEQDKLEQAREAEGKKEK